MSLQTPRLRMFAGPNGSGKSTIKEVINGELLGIYINPDEIEKEIKKFDYLDFTHYEISTNEEEVLAFFRSSTLLKNADMLDDTEFLRINENKLDFFELPVNSYFASVCADFIRKKLLESRKSFTFETVMSSYDKIELLELAQKLGYRTYLYFVATSDPIINISRVKNRVCFGGHNVPEGKIISRYYRSMENLSKAIKYSNRAYIFDNSNHSRTWIAEITNAKEIEIKTDKIPAWFNEYCLKSLVSNV